MEFVRIEETEIELSEIQTTYIPLGAADGLNTSGQMRLTIIEIQTGAWPGGDDIVRFDDIYGQSNDGGK